jgi:hypothetical protein
LKFDGSDDSPATRDGFIVDFSLSFLPIGLFDRLVCLLVEHYSICFQDNSHQLLVGNGIVLMSFGERSSVWLILRKHERQLIREFQRCRISPSAQLWNQRS